MYSAQNAIQPEESTVKVPTVHPWAYFPTCGKCRASLGAGIPGLRWILAWNGRDAQNTGWCKGDHNSTVKMQFGGMTVTEAELPVECFGIFTEHLHLNCRRCGYRWLMECAPHKTNSFLARLRRLRKMVLYRVRRSVASRAAHCNVDELNLPRFDPIKEPTQ